MDLETRQKLIDTMYEIIQEEKLIYPKRILIRHPTQGGHASSGKTIKMKTNNDNHVITITISAPKYTLDENGRFYSKKDRSIKYKYEGWHEVSRERVIETAAHEMAHLKFWNHGPQHTSYSMYLFGKLVMKLGDWNSAMSDLI
jgi:hypothetical protein